MEDNEIKNIKKLSNKNKLSAEKIDIIYKNGKFTLLITLFNSILFSFLIWNLCDKKIIILWLLFNFILNILRYINILRYDKDNKDPSYWIKNFCIGNIFSGLSWSIALIFLFPPIFSHQIFLFLIIGGMLAGSVGIYSTIFNVFLSYCIPIAVPTIIYILFLNNEIYFSIGLVLTIFTIAMILSAKKIASHVDYTLNLKFEHSELLEELKKEIDKRKLSETKLQELNNTKDHFFSIVAHDLRSPLASFMGIAELLYNDMDSLDTETINELLNSLHNSSINVFNLLENLLDWTTTQTGSIKVNIIKFDITTIINNTIPLLEKSAENKKIFIFSEVPKNSYIMADKNMIATIIRNLISNAIKFTKENGEIKISSTTNKDTICLSISDNGVGISEKNIEKILSTDKIHSTHGTSKEKGTGLGLTICFDFIKRNNGKMWIESEVDKGTTFYFSLPIAN